MTEIGHCVISMLEYSENVTIVWHMKSPMLQLVTIPKPFEFTNSAKGQVNALLAVSYYVSVVYNI